MHGVSCASASTRAERACATYPVGTRSTRTAYTPGSTDATPAHSASGQSRNQMSSSLPLPPLPLSLLLPMGGEVGRKGRDQRRNTWYPTRKERAWTTAEAQWMKRRRRRRRMAMNDPSGTRTLTAKKGRCHRLLRPLSPHHHHHPLPSQLRRSRQPRKAAAGRLRSCQPLLLCCLRQLTFPRFIVLTLTYTHCRFPVFPHTVS